MQRPHFETIDQYIKSFPKETQTILKKIRQIARKAAPKADEVISYQIPTFKEDGRYLFYFSAFAHHISFYPLPKTDKKLAKEMASYIKGKGTVSFQLDEKIPWGLVTKIIKARIKTARALKKKVQ